VLHVAECPLNAELMCECMKAQSKSTLLSVDFSWCDTVNDTVIELLCARSSDLEELWCRRLSISDGNQFLRSLTKSCPRMRIFAIPRCGAFTDEVLAVISESNWRSSLERLDLAWNECLTTAGVSMLLQACSKLSYMSLEGCKGVDASLSRHI